MYSSPVKQHLPVILRNSLTYDTGKWFSTSGNFCYFQESCDNWIRFRLTLKYFPGINLHYGTCWNHFQLLLFHIYAFNTLMTHKENSNVSLGLTNTKCITVYFQWREIFGVPVLMYLISTVVYFNQLFASSNADHLLKRSPFWMLQYKALWTDDLPCFNAYHRCPSHPSA